MDATTILGVRLKQTPWICKEVDTGVEPDPARSLQMPIHGARRGQMEAHKWMRKIPVGALRAGLVTLWPGVAVPSSH